MFLGAIGFWAGKNRGQSPRDKQDESEKGNWSILHWSNRVVLDCVQNTFHKPSSPLFSTEFPVLCLVLLVLLALTHLLLRYENVCNQQLEACRPNLACQIVQSTLRLDTVHTKSGHPTNIAGDPWLRVCFKPCRWP